MYRFIPTTEEHIRELIYRIRYEDQMEIDAISGNRLGIVIRESVERSDEAWTAFDDEGIIAIFGVGRFSLLSDKACPWAVTTNLVEKHKKDFAKATKIALNYWLNKYEELENYVDARYTRAIRWLDWAGFTVYPAQPYGAFGQLFHKVTMRRPDDRN